MYGAIQNRQLDVIIAFSTDGRIAAYHLTTLSDPRQAMPPYDAMILLSPRAARNPALVEALKPLLNGISTETMRAANKRVDLDKESPDQSAAELLKEVVRP
jgi:osmoprotectant transport system permease protein